MWFTVCGSVLVPAGLCPSISVLLCLNLFGPWFPVTGVKGQLAWIRAHDPCWPRCQLNADKNGCTRQACERKIRSCCVHSAGLASFFFAIIITNCTFLISHREKQYQDIEARLVELWKQHTCMFDVYSSSYHDWYQRQNLVPLVFHGLAHSMFLPR